MRTAIDERPQAPTAPTAPAPPGSRSGPGTRKKGFPWFYKEKVRSKGVARSSFLTSWCFMAPTRNGGCACCRGCLSARDGARGPHAFPTAARDCGGSALAPPPQSPRPAVAPPLRARPAPRDRPSGDEPLAPRAWPISLRDPVRGGGGGGSAYRTREREKRPDHPPITRGLGAARPLPRPSVALLWKRGKQRSQRGGQEQEVE